MSRRLEQQRPAPRDRRPQALLVTLIGVGLLVAMINYLPSGVISRERGSADAEANRPPAAPLILSPEQARLKSQLDKRYQQAVVMLHAKQYEYAVTALQGVLAIAPRLPEGYLNLGFALLGLERHDDAREAFLRAIDLRPEMVNAYYGLAMAEEGAGNMMMAIGAMQSFVHLNKDGEDPFRRQAEAALWEWQDARRKTLQAETDSVVDTNLTWPTPDTAPAEVSPDTGTR